MTLIQSHRHTKRDLAHWGKLVRTDRMHARSQRFARRVDEAIGALVEFAERGSCYCGVSWGKDSVVVAHLVRVHAPSVPLVWVRVDPIENPDCVVVRDAFLRSFPGPYFEHSASCRHDAEGWHSTGTLEAGFKLAIAAHGKRHISGVRADESGIRKIRMRHWGHSSENTCAPIGWWSGQDVYAYLDAHDLPVHPAYACTMGGILDRDRVRVASLGGKRGRCMGRHEWERTYYRRELRELGMFGYG